MLVDGAFGVGDHVAAAQVIAVVEELVLLLGGQDGDGGGSAGGEALDNAELFPLAVVEAINAGGCGIGRGRGVGSDGVRRLHQLAD